MFKKFKIRLIKTLLYLLDKDHRTPEKIGTDNMKKFTHVERVKFESDFGVVKNVYRTIPYEVWELVTETHRLFAADRHRIVMHDYSMRWVENIQKGDRVMTETGIEFVKSCKNLGIRTHMYCLEVESESEMNHLYHTDGILSHNTTCAAAYILWKAMFEPDSTI